jgi:hypothetical protein
MKDLKEKGRKKRAWEDIDREMGLRLSTIWRLENRRGKSYQAGAARTEKSSLPPPELRKMIRNKNARSRTVL